MVKIIDNAKFNKAALLGELAHDAYELSRPGDDYVKATHLVWNAMRNQAVQTGSENLTGDKGRKGYALVGMGPSQALQLIWPGMEKLELARVRTAVVMHLKASNNALCIKQGRGWSLAEWWIANEWQEINLSSRSHNTYKPRKVKPKKAELPTKVEPKKLADTLEPDDPTDDVVDAPTSVDHFEPAITADDLDKAFETIRRAFAMLGNLQDENKHLRDRLDRITDVIKGE
jgi:hypothetical protein